MVISSERYAQQGRGNGSRLPPPPPPAPPRSSRGANSQSSSQSLADHVAFLQAELDAAVRESRQCGTSSHAAPLPPPPPPRVVGSSSAGSSSMRDRLRKTTPPPSGKRSTVDRPPAVVHASHPPNLGKSLDGSSSSIAEIDSLSRSSTDDSRRYDSRRRGGGRRRRSDDSASYDDEYEYDEPRHHSNRKKASSSNLNSTLLMLNVLVGVLAALLGAAGGYVMSHARHGDLVLDTYKTLERLQALQQRHGGGKSSSGGMAPAPSPKSHRAAVNQEKAPEYMKGLYDPSKLSTKGVTTPPEPILPKPKPFVDDSVASHLRKMEYQNAVERYGEGPHRIMFTLEVPYSYYPDVKPTGHGTGVRKRFYVETVPLSLMPHSVRTFLDMIDGGLYNGVQFNVITRDGNPAIDFDHKVIPAAKGHVAERFLGKGGEAALDRMEYDERHADVVHGRGTVAFLGRGPGMVVNLNAGGRRSLEEAGHHGCFARVVEGLDVLEDVIAAQGAGALREPVTIRLARMVLSHEQKRK